MTRSTQGILQIELATANQDVQANTADEEVARLAHGFLLKNLDTDAEYTLSTSTTPPEYSYKTIKFTDTGAVLTAGQNIVIPAANWMYWILNYTDYPLTIKVSGGTGFAVPNDSLAVVFCDGTDCIGHVLDATST